MEENEAVEIVLDLNVKDAEETLESFMKGMESLQNLAQNIGAELRKAFTPLQASLQKTVSGIQTMTDALTATSSAIQSLMEQMANEQVADQWMSGISTAIDAISLGLDFSEIAEKIKPTFEKVTTNIHEWANTSFLPLMAEVFSGEGIKSTVMALGGTMSDMVGSIGDVISKLWESILAWGTQTAAKLANKEIDLQIIALYAGNYVKQFGVMVGQLAASTAGWVANTAAKVASTAAEWAQIAATTAWTAICATAAAVTSAFGAAMSVLTSPITLVVAAIAAVIGVVVLLIKNWDTVKAAAISAWESIKEAFGKAWTWFKGTVVDPLVNGFKGAVNGVIGFINGLIAGVVKGINSIVQMLNSLKFTVPDWVPGLGGQTLGFHLKTVATPQIPYLAKGAVLPANKPFLAMVGDQRHGTNIEAPLATIQEAVAMTMEDFAAGNMAGHQATVAVLTQILEAVLGIHISDTEIGRAAERYQSKMAIARGNVW